MTRRRRTPAIQPDRGGGGGRASIGRALALAALAVVSPAVALADEDGPPPVADDEASDDEAPAEVDVDPEVEVVEDELGDLADDDASALASDRGVEFRRRHGLNLWPLLERRHGRLEGDSKLTIAWPVFEWEREGSSREVAVRPFFTYASAPTRDEYDWSMLWPLVQGWRENGESHAHALPLFWHTASETESLDVVAPLFASYQDLEEELSVFVAPGFLSWREGEERSIHLWPLFGYRSGEGGRRGWSTLWPLVGHDVDPSADAVSTDFLWPLARYERRGDDEVHARALPLFSYGRRGDSSHLLALLGGQWSTPSWSAGFALPAAFWGNGWWSAGDRHLITPLGGAVWSADPDDADVSAVWGPYIHARNGSGERQVDVAFPFLWRFVDRDGGAAHVFPFYGHHWDQDPDDPSDPGTQSRFVLFPLYGDLDDRRRQERGVDVLWPLVSWRSSPTRTHVRAMPLFLSESQGEQGERFQALVTVPAFFWFKWPLVGTSFTFTPVFARYSSAPPGPEGAPPQRETDRFFLLGNLITGAKDHRRDENGELLGSSFDEIGVLWPLAGRRTRADGSATTWALPLIYRDAGADHDGDGDYDSTTVLGPLYIGHRDHDGDEDIDIIPPLLYAESDVRREGGASSSWRLLGPAWFSYDRTFGAVVESAGSPDETVVTERHERLRIVGPFLGGFHDDGWGERTGWVAPLWFGGREDDATGEPETDWDVVPPLLYAEYDRRLSETREERLRLIAPLWFSWDHDHAPFDSGQERTEWIRILGPGLAGHVNDGDAEKASWIFPLLWDVHDGADRVTLALPLWARVEDSRWRLDSFLGPVGLHRRRFARPGYASEDVTSRDLDVLWPLIHYGWEGDGAGGTESSFRAFPLLFAGGGRSERWLVAPPLLWDFESDYSRTFHLWPLFGYWRRGRGDGTTRTGWSTLYPLVMRETNPGQEWSETSVLWPLFHDERSPHYTESRLLPMWWYERSGIEETGQTTSFSLLWPLVRTRSSRGGTRRPDWFISLLGYDAHDEEYDLRVLGRFYEQHRKSVPRRDDPLREETEFKSALHPFFSYASYGSEDWRLSILGSCFEYYREDHADEGVSNRRLRLFWIPFTWQRELDAP